MKITLQPVLLTLAFAASISLAGCASTASAESKPDVPTVTMTPLPAAPAPSATIAPIPPYAPPATSSTPASNSNAAKFYVIRAGDTGMKIARNHKLTISDLFALNPGVQWDRLRVGQTIRIHAE